MPSRDDLELEIKRLVIDVLMLEDITPDDIDSAAPLFNEGLGLDSIDSLDLGMALEERYGVKAGDAGDENAKRFASVRRLADFVAEHRTK
jgi:acyl carrier protein